MLALGVMGMNWCNDNLQWRTTMLQEKLVSLPFQPQMLRGLSWDWIWPSAVRNWWLTGFTVPVFTFQSLLCDCDILISPYCVFHLCCRPRPSCVCSWFGIFPKEASTLPEEYWRLYCRVWKTLQWEQKSEEGVDSNEGKTYITHQVSSQYLYLIPSV